MPRDANLAARSGRILRELATRNAAGRQGELGVLVAGGREEREEQDTRKCTSKGI